MRLETNRLLLRPWEESDAQALYPLASDPRVGPSAGWQPHTSVENSREIIRTVLSEPDTFAVIRREDGVLMGSIGIFPARIADADPKRDLEVGYWIGVPFWGNGYIPEAVRAMQQLAFTQRGAERLWCGYFDGNEKSRRVQEKCGFCYHHTVENQFWELTGQTLTEHFTCLRAEQWRAAGTEETMIQQGG